jgi:hypothetical protein
VACILVVDIFLLLWIGKLLFSSVQGFGAVVMDFLTEQSMEAGLVLSGYFLGAVLVLYLEFHFLG